MMIKSLRKAPLKIFWKATNSIMIALKTGWNGGNSMRDRSQTYTTGALSADRKSSSFKDLGETFNQQFMRRMLVLRQVFNIKMEMDLLYLKQGCNNN
jgi:hypothetical protein